MILCTLPYSQTTEPRSHATPDGEWVCPVRHISAAAPNVPLPFGADRKLLA